MRLVPMGGYSAIIWKKTLIERTAGEELANPSQPAASRKPIVMLNSATPFIASNSWVSQSLLAPSTVICLPVVVL